jgi:hypothetical protein
MNQKSIVLSIHMKGLDLDAIHEDLVRVLGENAIADSTVTKYIRSARFPPKQGAPSAEPMPVEISPVDQAILTALADYPFSSGRELSRLTCLPRSTVHRHLTRPLHFAVRQLRWIDHFLDPGQKQTRVNLARGLLHVLSLPRARQGHAVVTRHESWFYLRSDHDLRWTGPGEIVPDRER